MKAIACASAGPARTTGRSDASTIWLPGPVALVEPFRVFVPDCPGHGGASLAPGVDKTAPYPPICTQAPPMSRENSLLACRRAAESRPRSVFRQRFSAFSVRFQRAFAPSRPFRTTGRRQHVQEARADDETGKTGQGALSSSAASPGAPCSRAIVLLHSPVTVHINSYRCGQYGRQGCPNAPTAASASRRTCSTPRHPRPASPARCCCRP